MERLTKKKLLTIKDGYFYSVSEKEYKELTHNPPSFEEVYQKLGKYENLEEELGCPLEALIKALTEGIIFKIPTMKCGVKISGEIISLVNKTKELKWNDLQGRVLLKDYKKTWWLKKDRSE